MQKRDFIRTLGGATLGVLFGENAWAQYAALPPEALATDDDFWLKLRGEYHLNPAYINLENGYYSIMPRSVMDQFVERVHEVNYMGSRYMRTRQVDDKIAVRNHLAALAGVSNDELIITRNTTESLDTVISGFDWKPGDEAVMAEQDYGAMLDMFRLQERRYHMVNKVVSLPLDPSSDDEIVRLYESAITPRTRLLMVCHMVNITGQILPVRAITDMAHRHGVQVMVDGAHTFAQLDFTIPQLDCDYFGASLHKWLGTPLGAGILYVRPDRVPALWPIYADLSMLPNEIRKLNHTGTHPVHTDLAIENAVAFHQSIGIKRKEARLRFLQNYWTGKVRGARRIMLNTPTDPRRACAIANVGVDGVDPLVLAKTLFDKYHIWTVGINSANVHGVRITPQLFTTTDELDALVRALREIAA